MLLGWGWWYLSASLLQGIAPPSSRTLISSSPCNVRSPCAGCRNQHILGHLGRFTTTAALSHRSAPPRVSLQLLPRHPLTQIRLAAPLPPPCCWRDLERRTPSSPARVCSVHPHRPLDAATSPPGPRPCFSSLPSLLKLNPRVPTVCPAPRLFLSHPLSTRSAPPAAYAPLLPMCRSWSPVSPALIGGLSEIAAHAAPHRMWPS
jgi:hypothetical protein